MNNKNSHIIPNDKAIDLLLAGNCTFTAKSLKTNVHYTYRIIKLLGQEERKLEYKENRICYGVYILVSANEDYRYLGIIFIENKDLTFKAFKTVEEDTPSYLAFKSVINITYFKQLHPLLQLWSSGKCARCGKTLTTEDSVELGIGPECVKKNYEYIKSLNL